jgi:o-succinylbenzoate synthase
MTSPSQDTAFPLSSARLKSFDLELTEPLTLSREHTLRSRTGFLLLIELETSNGRVAGVGEICPLPRFHKESLEEAEAQLKLVVKALDESHPQIPQCLLRLDQAMTAWLDKFSTTYAAVQGALLSSVRAGLEMALLHALSRAVGSSHIGELVALNSGRIAHGPFVGINALLVRAEDLGGIVRGATVLKVKVGRNPQDDAARINGMAARLVQNLGPNARLRLDANQAWSVEEALVFLMGLSDQAVALVEYLEEPVSCKASQSLCSLWEELAEKSQSRVPLAVDESLTEGTVLLEDVAQCRAPIVAVLLKPALQGLEQCCKIIDWALERRIQPILSSAFESSVALCHFALLATLTNPSWCASSNVSVCHGLSTFNRLAEDTMSPSFGKRLLCDTSEGWRIDVRQCQQALNQVADELQTELLK